MADTWVCPNCGTEWDEVSDFCPNCGRPAHADPTKTGPITAVVRTESIGDPVARVVVLFAIVGVGLTASTLLFLWSIGFFRAVRNFEDIGGAILGGFAIALVFVFSVLIGAVISAVGGMYIGDRAPSSGAAALGGAIAGGLGHLAMLVVVAGTLIATAYAVATSGEPQLPAVPTPTPTVAAECAETFGADSPICTGVSPSLDIGAGDNGVTAKNLGKLALTALPSALVGALTASVLYDRRRRVG